MSGYDLNAAMGGASPDIIPAEWSQCQGCGRTFNESAFAKHTKICDKVFCAKRSTFDSKKHRLNGTEAAQVSGGSKGAGKRGAASNTRGRSDRSGGASSALNNGSMPKWKTQSSQLREAMKASRQVAMAQKEAERRGVPLASVLPPSSSPGGGASYEDPSFIRCPHCNRTFNEKVYFLHLAFFKLPFYFNNIVYVLLLFRLQRGTSPSAKISLPSLLSSRLIARAAAVGVEESRVQEVDGLLEAFDGRTHVFISTSLNIASAKLFSACFVLQYVCNICGLPDTQHEECFSYLKF